MHKIFLPFITLAITLFVFLSSFEIERKDYLFEYNRNYDDSKQIGLDTLTKFIDLQKSVIANVCDMNTGYLILNYNKSKKIPLNSFVLCMWKEGNCVLIRSNNIIRINDTTNLNTDQLLLKLFNPDKKKRLPIHYRKAFFDLSFSANYPIEKVTNALDSIYLTYEKGVQKVVQENLNKPLKELSKEELIELSSHFNLNILISFYKKDSNLNFEYEKDDLLSNLNN